MRRAPALLSSIPILVSCRAELPSRPDGTAPVASGAMVVTSLPAAPAGSAPTVAQLIATLPPGSPVDRRTVALVHGDVSDVALRGYRDGSPPSSTAEREVAVITWTEGATLVVAPSEALAPGDRYALVVGSAMAQSTITVVGDDVATLRRIWPPSEAASAVDEVVLCGDGAIPPGTRWLGRVPSALTMSLRSGALDDDLPARCVTVTADAATSAWPMPVALVEGERVVAHLPPTPLLRTNASTAGTPTTCDEGEVALASLCLAIDDDRVHLRAPPPPLLLVWDVDEVRSLTVTTSATTTLLGLAPETTHHLRVRVHDLGGMVALGEADIVTMPAHAHVVVNEVLTYPRGDIGSSQWVELVNDGAIEADLAGYSLDDGHMAVTLPTTVLAPGAFGVVVRDGFAPNGIDVAPARGALLVPVPRLGRGALTERGTTLLLRDPGGAIVSRLPATPEPTRGVSVCRVRPDAPDDDPSAFVLAKDGAPTPGAPNGLP